MLRYGVSHHGSSPLTFTEVRHAGGAIKRVASEAAAYSHRYEELLLGAIAITPTPELYQQTGAYAEQFKRDLQAHLTGGVYLNFLDVSEARARTREAYAPEAYQRLQTVKAKYDPANWFKHSFEVVSAA